ncbi:MAG: DUF3047 domain-containing protein [Salinisphaeraceae bacterium]|nr:DUF3047 domain-containing protein [Salinisphaeraceae bacterium]
MNKYFQYAVWLAALSVALPSLLRAEAVRVASFSAAEVKAWEPHVFSKATRYSLVKQSNGDDLLAAQCQDSASALVLRQKIDLHQTPYLSWSWRVQDVFDGLDEKQKSGDDFAARVYVVIDGGLLPWKSRAINYVWSSSHPVGSNWENPYAPEQVRMVAVRSGPPTESGMMNEVRNVREDFRELFGMDVDSIDAVAIMTDCDNSDAEALAWYGTLQFEPTRQARLLP